MNFVVDSNVAIVANGKNTHASLKCQYECVEFLQRITATTSRDVVLLDQLGLILREYRAYLAHRGQPGVGDAFYRYLHDHVHEGRRVMEVSITEVKDQRRGFEELPVNEVDPSDRKFLAVAVVSRGVVVNATDGDWNEQLELLDQLQVKLRQLCPEHS
jgi:hypothetical protein